jgi:hypothetical protein
LVRSDESSWKISDAISVAHRLRNLITIHLFSCRAESAGSTERFPGSYSILDRVGDLPGLALLTLDPVPGLVMVSPIDLHDLAI